MTPAPDKPQPLSPAKARLRARAAYHDPRCPERDCDHCGRLYRGPAVYCSIECALADAQPLDLVNEPCQCPSDQCAHFVEPPEHCINRLTGEVRTGPCAECGSGMTWHQDGECLRCRRRANPQGNVAG